jgi:drug/metabolite transporter (DMT)-like permease
MVNAVVIPAIAVAILTALQSVMQKSVAMKLSHQTLAVLFSIGYFVLTLAYLGWHQELVLSEIRGLVVPVILALVAAIIVGFIANIMYFSILRHNEISLVSALTGTVPLFVAGLSFLILKEALSPKQIAGIAAIVGGTILLS